LKGRKKIIKIDKMVVKSEKETEVTILGNNVSERQDGGGVVWGSFLIFIGIVLLLNTFNVVSWEVWQSIWQFWPILLILGGIHVVLGNNQVSRVIMTVLSLAIFALLLLLVIKDPYPQALQNLPLSVQNAVQYLEGFRK
jgi:predicted ferric reductase